jgi:hypothetical protein
VTHPGEAATGMAHSQLASRSIKGPDGVGAAAELAAELSDTRTLRR